MGLTGLLVCGGVGFGVFLRTDAGARWTDRQVLRLLDTALSEGHAELGQARVDLLGNVRLTGLTLYGADGTEVLSVDEATMQFAPEALLSRRLRAQRLTVQGVYADLRVDDEGVLELSRMFGGPSESEEPWGGLPIGLDLEDVRLVGGEVRYRTPDGMVAHVNGVEATATVAGSGTRIAVNDLHVDAVVVAPGPLPLALRGGVVYDGGALDLDDVVLRAPGTQIEANGHAGAPMDLELRVLRADLARLDPILGSSGLTGTLEASMNLLGPPDDLRLVAVVEGTGETEGTARVRLGANASGERWFWTATGELDDLHVDHFVTKLTEPIVLDGDLDLKGAGLAWPDELSITGRWEGGEQLVVGQKLSAVDVDFNIRDGVVYVDDTSVVTGIVGTIHPDGWYDVQSGLIDMNASGALTPTTLAELGVEGLGVPGTYDVKLIGATGGEEPLHVRGTARFDRGFRYEEVRAARMNADFALDIVDGRVGGMVAVDGSGLDAYGLTSVVVVAPALRVDVADGHTTVLGELSLGSVAYAPALTAERIDVQLSVDAGETLRTEAALVVGPYAFLEQPGTSGTGRIKLFGDLLDFQIGLQDGARTELDVLGRFRLDDGTADIVNLDWSPTPRIDWRLTKPAHLRVSEAGGIEDTDIHWTSELGDIQVRGVLGAAGPLDAEVVVDGLQLDMLSELFPVDVEDLSGTASAVVHLNGSAEEPDVMVDFRVADLYFGGAVRYLDIDGSAHWKDDALRPNVSVAVADQPLLEIQGSLPLRGPLAEPLLDPDGLADLTVHVRPGDFQRFEHVSPSVEAGSMPQGQVSAAVNVRGPWRDPVLHTAGVAEVDVEGWQEPGRVEFDAVYDAGGVSFWSDLREGYEQRANLGGGGLSGLGDVWSWAVLGEEEPDLEDYTLWIDQMFVSGVLLGVPARSLMAMTDLGLFAEGELVGGVSVTGNPYEPVVEGGVHWLDARLGETTFDGAYASLTPAEVGYDLNLQLDFPPPKLPGVVARTQGGGVSRLTVVGPVPVVVDTRTDYSEWSVADMELDVSGEGLPLSLLQVANPGIQKARGWVALDGAVGGTLADPSPVVGVNLEDGSLQYAPLGLAINEITIHATADKEHIDLETFSFEPVPRRRFRSTGVSEVGQRPRVRASGEAKLEDWTPASVAIGIKLADGAWLSATDDVMLRADGQLAVSGAWPALKVGGDLEAVFAQVVLDAASFLDTAPLDLDSRISIVRDERAAEREDQDEEPPFYADFIVDVDVDLKRNLEVDVSMPFIDDLGSLGAAVTRADVSSRLGGDLQATMTGGELDLVGEVEVIEGKVRVLRSSFNLQDGNVVFTGGEPFNPVLDLSADMALSDATVAMNINGTPEQPEIRFTSEEYPDQTQIMTILLTGRAPSDMDSAQGQGTAQALAQLLLNSMFAGQSLGSFSIEPDGSVRLGVPISQAVYASSTLAPTQSVTENRLSVGLEWSLLPRVVASGAVGDRRSSADVYWEIRF